MLDKNPMSTKSVTAAIFFTTSDITAQVATWTNFLSQQKTVFFHKLDLQGKKEV